MKSATPKSKNAKKAAKKRVSAKKTVAKRAPARKTPEKRAPPKKPTSRADFGAPVDGFFERQPEPLRAILIKLRGLVQQAAPDADASIKWGMPFYAIGGTMMCALGAHKAHVNLILAGTPGTYFDPDERLAGDGKTGRHLKLTSVAEIPVASVRRWLKTAALLARTEKS